MTDPDTISADYTLRPSELAATLALLVEARQPVIVWGAPGTAKSMIARQVAAAAGRTYIDVRALLLDPVDLRGIPWRDSDDRTRWAPPSFLPPSDNTGRFLINLEELPSAPPMVQAALYQLVLDRKCGEYELPDGASLIACGILFATYATLRSPARQGKPSRLDQIVAWLADGEDEDDRHAFAGVIVFDEAHAMANAAGSKGSRGEVRPSQQGRAGLRLQNALPDARILYVSATGATTVPGLAYARRLGLWASGETPFETRTAFVGAMEAGGVAAMEVVARDLKALGLYQGPRA